MKCHINQHTFRVRTISSKRRSRAIARRTARCRCKFQFVSNFTTASCGFSATARWNQHGSIGCNQTLATVQMLKLNKVRWFSWGRRKIHGTRPVKATVIDIIGDNIDLDNISPSLLLDLCPWLTVSQVATAGHNLTTQIYSWRSLDAGNMYCIWRPLSEYPANIRLHLT